jgi:GT2 family glycosyltransferase
MAETGHHARLSLVVPCHNRAAYLDVFLRSLTWSTVPFTDFEVIVVDDGSTDSVSDVVAAWCHAGLDVRLIELRRHGGPRNNAVARNAGLRAARHPIVLQTDPDIVFVSDVLATAREQAAPGRFLSPGGYLPLTESATLALMRGARGPSRDPEEYRAAARGRPDQVRSPDGVGGLHGAFVCLRDDLIAAGGYDESFTYWGWEDRELIVTLSDRGLERRYMPRTAVVHLWHPPARGDVPRDVLASEGRVSRAAWDVQLQRVSAEHPRRRRPQPARATAVRDRPCELGPDAYEDWVTPDARDAHHAARSLAVAGHLDLARRRRPLIYQLFFDAQVLEARQLRLSGHVAVARLLLRRTLERPWEKPFADPSVADVGLELYDGVLEALEELAACEEQLGRRADWDAVCDMLAARQGGAVVAAAVRARWALRRADLEAATRELPALRLGGWTAARLALAIEIALLSGDAATALDIADSTSNGSGCEGNYFEQLRLIEYLHFIARLAPSLPASRVWTWLGSSDASGDETEFVYSAAVRSMREGLHLAACLLAERFNAGRGVSEWRVRGEARDLERAMRAQVSRMANAGTIGWLGYRSSQYNDEKAFAVFSQA